MKGQTGFAVPYHTTCPLLLHVLAGKYCGPPRSRSYSCAAAADPSGGLGPCAADRPGPLGPRELRTPAGRPLRGRRVATDTASKTARPGRGTVAVTVGHVYGRILSCRRRFDGSSGAWRASHLHDWIRFFQALSFGEPQYARLSAAGILCVYGFTASFDSSRGSVQILVQLHVIRPNSRAAMTLGPIAILPLTFRNLRPTIGLSISLLPSLSSTFPCKLTVLVIFWFTVLTISGVHAN